MKLSDLNLLSIGNTINISGVIYSGEDKHILCWFPEENEFQYEMHGMTMSLEEWEKFLRQTDVMEVEVLQTSSNGELVKAILRKSQRQIDNFVMWTCFKRDSYQCRYCGKDGIPLTVDHVVTWESGGPTTLDNLLTSCKKCNKLRGNKPYELWMVDKEYNKARKLTVEQLEENLRVVQRLDHIPRNTVIRSR